jgi:hypothetical protein
MCRAEEKTSALAITSLILSCAAVLLGPLGAIPGIILGILAIKEIKKKRRLTGIPIAVTGIVIGCVFMLLFIAVACFIVYTWTSYNRMLKDF